MLNKFWMWLLGLKDEESKGESNKPAGGSASSSSETEDEGNFRSGTDGYQSGGYEGR